MRGNASIFSVRFQDFEKAALCVQATDENTVQASCALNTDPRSRATVRLSSTDINDPPTVDTNIMAQSEELERMVLCFERDRAFGVALESLGFNLTEVLPGSETSLEDAVRLRPPAALGHNLVLSFSA